MSPILTWLWHSLHSDRQDNRAPKEWLGKVRYLRGLFQGLAEGNEGRNIQA
jgi:hypothetical protein